MSRTKLIISFVILLLFTEQIHAQNFLSKVKIYPENKQQRDDIIALLEIDHFMPTRDNGIEAELSQPELARLKRSRVKHEVLIDNINRWLDSSNRVFFRTHKKENGRVAFEKEGKTVGNIISTPSAFEVKTTFAGYYQFSEMETAMNTLVASYPTIASKTEIGTTYGGRKLWVIKISDNVGTDESEPEAFFMGLQHPREAITGASMIFFMQYLCEQYASNDKIKELVNNREIFIMPCFNPDGYVYNYESMGGAGGGSWRKNRRKFGTGGNVEYGVDLNRNWGVDWGNCGTPIMGNAGSCGSGSTAAETYYGPSAFSENETQALRAFAKTRHFKTAFDQHAYGPYYSVPFGRQSLHNTAGTDMSPKDSAFYKHIPALMGKYNGMRAADSYDALGYEVAGGFKDWMLTGEVGVGTKDSVWGITGEGSAGGGTSAYGSMSNFWAPASQIVNLCKGMCYQNIQLALAAGSYADIQDASDIELNAKSGNLSFRLQRLGLTDNSFTASIVPLQNIATVSAAVTIPSLTYNEVYNGNIAYTLPASITNGQQIQFVWQVETGGITYSDTVTKLYNPTTMFSDDMEGSLSTNWNTYGSAGSSGYGFTYVEGLWMFTTSGGYNSNKALSESAAGTRYGSKTRAYAQCKTVFNLSDATSAYLSFWVRHRAENFRDKVQVQVSKDGTTWKAISGKTTIQEPGTLDESTINGSPALTGVREIWTQEFFNLEEYKSQPTVLVRFEFTSDDDLSGFEFQTDDGFYIDNVKLVKSTAAITVLPANIWDFNAVLQANKTVELSWNGTNTETQSHYEIHRSADGTTYKTIGRVEKENALKYVDVNPLSGPNYYRIVGIDKNGQTSFSGVNLVTLTSTFKVSVYPNPTTDHLFIHLFTEKPSNLTVQIIDIAGRQVFTQNINMFTTNQEISVNMKDWSSQLYILKIIRNKNEILSTQRILKN